MRTVHVVGAAIVRDARCLVAQRGPSMSLPGRWEFPGGKVGLGEAPRAALTRELREELGIGAEVGEWLGRGDAVLDAQHIRLDVYIVRADTEAIELREHAAVRWVEPSELASLDWAAADVPVLPALRAHLAATPDEHRCPAPVALIAADWGKQAGKRAAYAAERDDDGWAISRLDGPPARPWSVAALLEAADRMRRRLHAGVLVGIDVSLGVPTALARRVGASGFIDFLDRLERARGLENESPSAAEWRPETPFFRVPPGHGGKRAFFAAAGGETMLLRQIELRTRANPTFALSGIPGTVGSGTRAAWQEIVPLLRARDDGGPSFRLWPYEGSLRSLLSQRQVVLAEIYPRTAYSLALSADLPAAMGSIAKTKAAARTEALLRLQSAAWLRSARVGLPDLSRARANEDDFDALLTVAAMVRGVAEGRPLACPLVDPFAEGGILATGGIELASPGDGRRSSTRRPRATARRTSFAWPAARGRTCPVPGCGKVFQSGRSGWDAHAASGRTHPDWRPDLLDPEERKAAFRSEFGGWFEGS